VFTTPVSPSHASELRSLAVPSIAPGTENDPQMTGDPRILTSRLGSPALVHADTGLGSVPTGLPTTPETLRAFLEAYRDEVLSSKELPAMLLARELAFSGKARELIALDQEWGMTAATLRFAEASVSVGRRQLGRLRPMQDVRVVQKYAQAVESGVAQGWHVIVYGIALAVFSVPTRSGLLHYAQQTLGGFLDSAPTSSRLTEATKREIWQALDRSLPEVIACQLPQATALRIL